MCKNDRIEYLNEAHNYFDTHTRTMDTPPSLGHSTTGSHDDTPRVKLLCSFLGNIMPRPQDGKLRYVGGETRIVSLPRDICFEELMIKMKELYEGAAVLKYQQPDEDLDALVSVVNDDDVTNMMEEYDKLDSGDGFTRLRIFLSSHPDQDGSSHYVDGDEKESERRYVDALNNLNEGADFRRQQGESPLVGAFEDVHIQEQFFNPIDMSVPQFNLHQITVPQRHNEMDGSWSPAYYSPRHHGHHDPRSFPEFPNSPPSRYRMQFGELPDRASEEYARAQLNHPPAYEHPPQYAENVVWIPPGAISADKSGFPGNLLQGSGVAEGNSGCEHCRAAIQRNQLHLEQPNIGNVGHQSPSQCAECHPNREHFNAMYPKGQNDPRSIYNEAHERGWNLPHQLSSHGHPDEARTNISGAGRINEHYMVDGPGINYPLGHVNLVDAHHTSPNYIHHRAGHELGNEVFHDQPMAASHLLHVPSPEERAVRYGNIHYGYGIENPYPMSHGHLHPQNLWRNVQGGPMHGASPYETSGTNLQVNGTVNSALLRGTTEGSQRIGFGMDGAHSRVDSHSPQKIVGIDGTTAPEYAYGHPLNSNHHVPMNKTLLASETTRPRVPFEVQNSSASFGTSGFNPELTTNTTEVATMGDRTLLGKEEANGLEKVENLVVPNTPHLDQNMFACTESEVPILGPVPTEKGGLIDILGQNDLLGDSKVSLDRLSFLPELMASVKKAALEEAEEVKARVEETTDTVPLSKEAHMDEAEAVAAHEEPELGSDGGDNINTNEIEQTKAESEAFERGLQTIRNDDLEEIRELGSGTYGAVYHGKWKGSDVAIKRIKASCFAGRPSERERLIADFWKEALILSSLHHPNVVSFYGIVRDGPDGSLATVTEFMVNGSLKQFLQKKDRTIDRRKRLIIAMDAAFGMEYLHGKNIVHFDLKCENLLVNMRDPQRPICKIGDLGLSKVKQQTLVSGGVRGTLPWMAPELLSGKSHMVTEKIDVYSFGIVMWELLTGEEPYAGLHCASIIGGIVNDSLRPTIPTWCDPEWKSLMASCWDSDPSVRPSFTEISKKLRNMAAAINVK
ncbi:Protein kinase superfamily protein with octicosapeptide/Phox/Bem1p domain [Euphorbia peplus]|nr:Protein kinase superfamily protein with octicosapeptide/Phox/Bem1p domain [Euphorbia peplus]